MIPLVLAQALALAASGPPASDRVVEEIAAVVRNPSSAPPRVVTLTKLTEEARVALVSRGATAAATGPLDREALRAALEWLIDQMLVADEAARLRIGEVPREDVLDELRKFRAVFAGSAQYARFLSTSELTEEELLVSLARMMQVQRYVESRVGRAARVGDDEVDRWLRDRGSRAVAGRVREAARAQLAEEKARAQVRDLLAELRGRAEIRIMDAYRKAVPGRGQPDEAGPARAGEGGEPLRRDPREDR
jgi:hypothetical protein